MVRFPLAFVAFTPVSPHDGSRKCDRTCARKGRNVPVRPGDRTRLSVMCVNTLLRGHVSPAPRLSFGLKMAPLHLPGVPAQIHGSTILRALYSVAGYIAAILEQTESSDLN